MASMRCSCQTAPLHSQRLKTCCMQHCGIKIMSPAIKGADVRGSPAHARETCGSSFSAKKGSLLLRESRSSCRNNGGPCSKTKNPLLASFFEGPAKPKRQQSRFFLPQRVWGKVRTGKYFSEPPLFIFPNEAKKLSYAGAPDGRPQSIPLS